jgi:hypothetical protein
MPKELVKQEESLRNISSQYETSEALNITLNETK